MSIIAFTLLIIFLVVLAVFFDKRKKELNTCPKCGTKLYAINRGKDNYLDIYDDDTPKRIIEIKCSKCGYNYFFRQEIYNP